MLNEDDKKFNDAHWRKTRKLCGLLLASWFLLTFVSLFFARELATMTVLGWPLSFYIAAQGLSLFYVVLLAVLSVCSHRISRRTAHNTAKDAELKP